MSIDEIEQTAVEGLFERTDVATPADDTMQWRAALLQLVNWGGFGGLTTVPLRGDATTTICMSAGTRAPSATLTGRSRYCFSNTCCTVAS